MNPQRRHRLLLFIRMMYGGSRSMSFSFWQKWLSIAAGAVVAIGLFLALTGFLPYSEPVNRLINQTFWPGRAVSVETSDFQRWVYGILGATVAGWGVLLLFVARVPFKKKERWSRQAILVCLAVWFPLDTALSLYHGVYLNAAFNATLAMAIGLPAAITGRFFR